MINDAAALDAGTPLHMSVNGHAAVASLDSALFKHVPVTLEARLGDVTLTVADLLNLTAGSVLTLDAQINETIEIRLDSTVLARGEIVAVGDRFGVRVTEVAPRA